MRVQLQFALVGMVAMAQLPAVGHAQSPSPSAQAQVQAQTQAKGYVDQGIAAYNAGQYDVAIAYYWKAYQLVPHPDLIFNIAQAQRLSGRLDDALAMYQRYLEKDPDGSQASIARQLVAELKAKLEATAPGAVRPEPPRVTDPSREGVPIGDAHPATSKTATTGVANESPPTPGANLRLAGMVTGVAGLVAFGVAINYGLVAQSRNDWFEKNQMFDQQKYDEGNRADAIQIAAWITGGVLVGTGGVLYYLGREQGRHAQSVTVAPVVSRELTGLAVSGTLP